MNYNNLPNKPTARYRPKADREILSRLMRDAWKLKTDEWISRHEALISSAATERLESVFPQEDMRVLEKYGQAKAIDSIGIRIYNHRTDRWDVGYRAELKRPVLAVDYAELSALRPQWWDEPNLGLKKEVTEEDWNDIVSRHEKSKANQMPIELDAVFTDWLDICHEHNQDFRIDDWIKDKKSTEGAYPTWKEIVAHCPVLLLIEEVKNWGCA